VAAAGASCFFSSFPAASATYTRCADPTFLRSALVSSELNGIDALADHHHLVLGVAGNRHRVDSPRLGYQRHGLGPALVAGHRHLDHDLLLKQDDSSIHVSVILPE
jgi:hypothetical protein